MQHELDTYYVCHTILHAMPRISSQYLPSAQVVVTESDLHFTKVHVM